MSSRADDKQWQWRLSSVKGGRLVYGTLDEAIEVAREMDESLQPSYGVTIEDAAGETVYSTADDEPGESGE